MRAQQSHWLPVGIALDHATARQHPHPVALVVAQSVLGLKRGQLATQVAGQCLIGHQQIIRVDLVAPQRCTDIDLVRCIAQHLRPAGVAGAHSLGEVVFPQAQFSTAEREFQALGICAPLPRLFRLNSLSRQTLALDLLQTQA